MPDHRMTADLQRVLAGLAGADQPGGDLQGAVMQLRTAGWLAEEAGALRTVGGWAVGLDLGGTKLAGMICDPAGRVLAERVQATGPTPFDQIVAMVRDLASAARIDIAALAQVALGVPGAVSPDGRVHLAPNVNLGTDINLGVALTAALGRPVSVWNDCNLAAYGEYQTGSCTEGALAFLALGTGIGMGVILNGQPLVGRTGAAGEIAYLPFGPDPFALATAHPEGGYEAAVGSHAIRDAYPPGDVTVKDIFDRADQGEALAVSLVAQVVANLAVGVGAVIALLDPALVVIGGGIGGRAGLAEAVALQVGRLLPNPCDIRGSRLGDRAGVMGALHMARDQALRAVAEGAPAVRGAA